jgi:hypothetical protein
MKSVEGGFFLPQNASKTRIKEAENAAKTGLKS